MRTQALMLLLSGAIGLTVSGCASSPIMRGQSPQPTTTSWEGGHAHSAHGECPMCDSGFAAAGYPVGGQYGGPVCGPNCGPNGHGHGGPNLPFHPVHRNSYTYSAPDGLMYPPAEAPAATYQYPYYTFRGPTDFFMK